MAVFRVERIKDYTVMSNHHLRNKNLSLKAKGLLSQMLSLPDDWDYTLKGLAAINKESVDAIRTAIWELEDAGYVVRTRVRDERGCLRGCDYYVYEYPQTPSSGSGGSAESVPPMLEPLASDSAVLGNPMQLNKEIQNVHPYGGCTVRVRIWQWQFHFAFCMELPELFIRQSHHAVLRIEEKPIRS